MTGRLLRTAAGAVSLLCASESALAHHSFTSEFNPNQILTIQGTVTEVSWTNPHVALKITVKDSAGPTVWTVHGDSPVSLVRKGWTRQTFAIGQQLAVCGYAGKTSANGLKMSGEQVTLPSGAQLTFSTTNIKSCLSPSVSRSNPTPMVTNPVGAMKNPVAAMANPIGPAGNPVSPIVSPTRQ
jgi:hypothetical protein